MPGKPRNESTIFFKATKGLLVLGVKWMEMNVATGFPGGFQKTCWWKITPFEKYARQIGFIIPKFRGENKKYLSCHQLEEMVFQCVPGHVQMDDIDVNDYDSYSLHRFFSL